MFQYFRTIKSDDVDSPTKYNVFLAHDSDSILTHYYPGVLSSCITETKHCGWSDDGLNYQVTTQY